MCCLSGISSNSVFPALRSDVKRGHISISSNMRPLQNPTKEDYESYLHNNVPPYFRRSPQQPRPQIRIVETKDKVAFENLKSKLNKVLSKHAAKGQSKHQKNNNKISLRDTVKIDHPIRAKKRPKSPTDTNQEDKNFENIFASTSSEEFKSREKEIFVEWNKKKFCDIGGKTIPEVTYTPDGYGLLPKNYKLVDQTLDEMLIKKRWRPGWPAKAYRLHGRRAGLDITTPLSVFQFHDLVVKRK